MYTPGVNDQMIIRDIDDLKKIKEHAYKNPYLKCVEFIIHDVDFKKKIYLVIKRQFLLNLLMLATFAE